MHQIYTNMSFFLARRFWSLWPTLIVACGRILSHSHFLSPFHSWDLHTSEGAPFRNGCLQRQIEIGLSWKEVAHDDFPYVTSRDEMENEELMVVHEMRSWDMHASVGGRPYP